MFKKYISSPLQLITFGFFVINLLILLIFPATFLVQTAVDSQHYLERTLRWQENSSNELEIVRSPFEDLVKLDNNWRTFTPDFMNYLERNGRNIVLITSATSFFLILLTLSNTLISWLIYKLSREVEAEDSDVRIQAKLLKFAALLLGGSWLLAITFSYFSWNAGVIGNEEFLQPVLRFIYIVQPTILVIMTALISFSASKLLLKNQELKQDTKFTI